MEVWKPYGSYEVSNLGNVKGSRGWILKPFLNRGGYLNVDICENGNRKPMKVHRLVALCFIPNPENKTDVDHINRDRKDNRVENLRWATRSENIINVGVKSNNKLGHKYISTTFMGNNEYWVIRIINPKIQKYFNKDKYTLEEVINERDKFCLEHNLPIN